MPRPFLPGHVTMGAPAFCNQKAGDSCGVAGEIASGCGAAGEVEKGGVGPVEWQGAPRSGHRSRGPPARAPLQKHQHPFLGVPSSALMDGATLPSSWG